MISQIPVYHPQQKISGLTSNWARLAPNGTNLGLFKINVLIWKSLRFVPFGADLIWNQIRHPWSSTASFLVTWCSSLSPQTCPTGTSMCCAGWRESRSSSAVSSLTASRLWWTAQCLDLLVCPAPALSSVVPRWPCWKLTNGLWPRWDIKVTYRPTLDRKKGFYYAYHIRYIHFINHLSFAAHIFTVFVMT